MNIVFSDLSVSAVNKNILRSVRGNISAGKITAIIGPNGSGKTTLMSSLAGLQKISSGTVMLGEHDCHRMDAKRRAQIIGYLPQKSEVNWNICVRHLVELGQTPVGKTDPDAVNRAMKQTNIAHLSDRKAMTLSGGELNRALFARVLAGDPDWIMLDEPMANLDLAHQLDMADLLTSLSKQGKNIVIILHDLNQAAKLADDFMIMSAGTIYANGPADQLCSAKMLKQVFGLTADIVQSKQGLELSNIARA